MATYAQDVADGLEILGVERFTLVGHSLGGAVATEVVELIPAKVAALVLLAPVGFGPIYLAELASLPVVRQLVHMALPWALSSRVAVTAAYATMVTNGRRPEAELVDRVTRNGRSLVDGTRKALRAIVDAGRCDRASGLRRVAYGGPVTAVWGDRDRLVSPSHRDGLRAALPQAQIRLWEGMGHHPIAERFDELAGLLTSATSPLAAQTAAYRQSTASGDPALADAA
jgi:pimeloyl-ACP methyl ester carboxylesterase